MSSATTPIVLVDPEADLHLLTLSYAALKAAAEALRDNGAAVAEHPTLNAGEFAAGTRSMGSWICSPEPLPRGFDDATSRHLTSVRLVIDHIGHAQRVGLFSNDTWGFCLTGILRSQHVPDLRTRESASSWLMRVLADLSVLHPIGSAAWEETNSIIELHQSMADAAAAGQDGIEMTGHLMLPTPTESGTNDADFFDDEVRAIEMPVDATPSCVPRVIVNAFELGGVEGTIGNRHVEWRRRVQFITRPVMATWSRSWNDPIARIRAIKRSQRSA